MKHDVQPISLFFSFELLCEAHKFPEGKFFCHTDGEPLALNEGSSDTDLFFCIDIRNQFIIQRIIFALNTFLVLLCFHTE
jgi:hypothetical protein